MQTHHRSSTHPTSASDSHRDWWTEKNLREDRSKTEHVQFTMLRPQQKSDPIWLNCGVIVAGVIALASLAKDLFIG